LNVDDNVMILDYELKGNLDVLSLGRTLSSQRCSVAVNHLQ